MNTFEMKIQSFKAKHEAFILGCDSVEMTALWDKNSLGEMDAFYSNDLTGVIIRIIASDGNISPKEVKYLNETFGLEYTLSQLVEVYNNCKEDIGHAFDESFENGITLLRRINSKLADAYKELLCLICDIITESDGVITPAEVEEVNKLKALCE